MLALGPALYAALPRLPTPDTLVFLGLGGAPVEIGARPALTLSRALQLEYHYHFNSTTSIAKLIYQTGSFSFWPLLFLAVLTRITGSATPMLNYLALLALSLPLYLIAHDWSRFAIYSLYATLVLQVHGIDVVGERLQHLRGQIERVVLHMPARFVVLFPLLFIAHDNYRTWGLHPANMLAIVIVLGTLVWLEARGRQQAS